MPTHAGCKVYTQSHLELIKNQEGTAEHTLYQLLDTTQTVLGSRLLKRWIVKPLRHHQAIDERQKSIQTLQQLNLHQIRASLSEFYDIERIASRIYLKCAKQSLKGRKRLQRAGMEPNATRQLTYRE
jgi:DNA mismatch repair protein MutS